MTEQDLDRAIADYTEAIRLNPEDLHPYYARGVAYQNKREYGRAIREIMALADIANEYVNDTQPWVIAKEEGQEERLQQICTTGINLFRILTIYLKPVLPQLAKQVENAAPFW